MSTLLFTFLFAVLFIIVFSIAFVIVVPSPSLVTLVVAGSIGGALVGLLVVLLTLLTAKKKQRQAAEELQQITAATRAYIEDLEQRHAFAPVAVPGLHLEQGEFAVRHDRATLAESRLVKLGGGLGTSVRVGGFPIYLGGWKSVPKEELRKIGTGGLVLTNRRLLFLGAHTLAIPF